MGSAARTCLRQTGVKALETRPLPCKPRRGPSFCEPPGKYCDCVRRTGCRRRAGTRRVPGAISSVPPARRCGGDRRERRNDRGAEVSDETHRHQPEVQPGRCVSAESPRCTNRRHRCVRNSRCLSAERRGTPRRAPHRRPSRPHRRQSASTLTAVRVAPANLPASPVLPYAHPAYLRPRIPADVGTAWVEMFVATIPTMTDGAGSGAWPTRKPR